MLYREEAWSESRDGLSTVFGYRVSSSPNLKPVRPRVVIGPPSIGTGLQEELDTGDPQAVLPVSIQVRGMPAWDIPLRPVSFALAGADLVSATDARTLALSRRKSVGSELLAPVSELVARLGGEVVARGELGGWLTARVPAIALRVLAQRPDLERISLLRGRPVNDGFLPMDKVRSADYLDVARFHDAGYLGETANPGRHGYGDITVGVVELQNFENESCFMFDGPNCEGASRLRAMYRCDDFDRDGRYCETVNNYRDNDITAFHPTAVLSVIAADYSDGQGDSARLFDPNWTSEAGHTATWESQRGGIAPEVSAVLFAQFADGDSDDGTDRAAALAEAYSIASAELGVDIVNSSWGFGSGCSLVADSPIEMEAENAFDDGVFMVKSAGNPNEPVCAGSGEECAVNADCDAGTGPCRAEKVGCNISSPGGIPKVFTVNGLNGEESACETAYGNCMADPNYSANGSIDVVSGGFCAGCVTGIDIAAPTRIGNVTSASGPRGNPYSGFTGTSASAPIVSGAAAIVKDWYLSNGQTFINDPGRLFAIMLNMGDRADHEWGDTSTTQNNVKASRLLGTGRLKLRLLDNGANMDPWGNHVDVRSYTAPGTLDYLPFELPIPAGAEIVKCVAYQVEDMSSKDDIAGVDLRLELRQNSSGKCSTNDPRVFTRRDAGTEIKHIAAVTGNDIDLGGKCLHVSLIVHQLSSAGGGTIITNCYYAGVLDDFSPPGI